MISQIFLSGLLFSLMDFKMNLKGRLQIRNMILSKKILIWLSLLTMKL